MKRDRLLSSFRQKSLHIIRKRSSAEQEQSLVSLKCVRLRFIMCCYVSSQLVKQRKYAIELDHLIVRCWTVVVRHTGVENQKNIC